MLLLPLGAFDTVVIHRFTDTFAPFVCLISLRLAGVRDPFPSEEYMQVPAIKVRAAGTHHRFKLLRAAFIIFAALMASMLGAGQLWAQCGSLKAPSTTWQNSGNSFWDLSGNWTSGTPTASTNACILNGTSTVELNTNGNANGLQLATGNTLNIDSGASLTLGTGKSLIDGLLFNSSGTITNSASSRIPASS